jgi:hypothetical protein
LTKGSINHLAVVSNVGDVSVTQARVESVAHSTDAHNAVPAAEEAQHNMTACISVKVTA